DACVLLVGETGADDKASPDLGRWSNWRPPGPRAIILNRARGIRRKRRGTCQDGRQIAPNVFRWLVAVRCRRAETHQGGGCPRGHVRAGVLRLMDGPPVLEGTL